jgi:HEAT repeat protein
MGMRRVLAGMDRDFEILMDTLINPAVAALAASDASVRLNAALAIGSSPDPQWFGALLDRCAVEPDFYVRDMLSWALTRFSPRMTVPRLVAELRSGTAQARSQALHTLSKIRDAAAWPAITPALLRDADDEVARSAWRAAVALVPDGQQKALAGELALQLGRGDRSMQLSLSRALLALGEQAVEPVLRQALTSEDQLVRTHAGATQRLLRDPDAAFELDVQEAIRVFVLSRER